jgi:hypothetical protein
MLARAGIIEEAREIERHNLAAEIIKQLGDALP